MNITTITVSYGQTQNLGDYSNVKMSASLGAELGDGDDPEAVRAILMDQAREFVHDEIDRVLEQHDLPAKYWTGPRYRVYATRTANSYYGERKGLAPLPAVVAIVPDGAKLDTGDWTIIQNYAGRAAMRYDHAKRTAIAYRDEKVDGALAAYQLIDCRDGQLARLPQRDPAELEQVKAAYAERSARLNETAVAMDDEPDADDAEEEL